MATNEYMRVMVPVDAAVVGELHEAAERHAKAMWQVVHGMRNRGEMNQKKLADAECQANDATAARQVAESIIDVVKDRIAVAAVSAAPVIAEGGAHQADTATAMVTVREAHGTYEAKVRFGSTTYRASCTEGCDGAAQNLARKVQIARGAGRVTLSESRFLSRDPRTDRWAREYDMTLYVEGVPA